MVILAGVTAALVADQKPPAQFQHAIDLPEALRQIRPEIDRFKGCDRIEPAVRKDDLLHTALPRHTAVIADRFSIELLGFLHADGRVIQTFDNALRALS